MASYNDVQEINSKSGPKTKSSPKKLRSITIERAENGGHIVEHRFENSGPHYHESEQHVFGKGEHKKMFSHVSKAMGVTGN